MRRITTLNTTGQAFVPWRDLKLDIVLIALAILVVLFSLGMDIAAGEPDWFQRSGSLMVLFSGVLASRGLNKHWRKSDVSHLRGYWLRTSRNQQIVDGIALVLLITGTLIWGYGDKLERLFI